MNEIDSFYNEEYSFDLDIDGSLQIAFGITYYDSNEERLDFGDIGEVGCFGDVGDVGKLSIT